MFVFLHGINLFLNYSYLLTGIEKHSFNVIFIPMLQYILIPYEENGDLKFRSVQIVSFSDPDKYDKYIKAGKEKIRRLKFHKKNLRLLLEKISEPNLYPTSNLWDQLITIIYSIYNEEFFPDFKQDIITLARLLSIRE